MYLNSIIVTSMIVSILITIIGVVQLIDGNNHSINSSEFIITVIGSSVFVISSSVLYLNNTPHVAVIPLVYI